jgi:hypothetical protein
MIEKWNTNNGENNFKFTTLTKAQNENDNKKNIKK